MAEHIYDKESCRQYLSMLSEYVDGELDAVMCACLEEHMADCPDCTIVVDTMKRTVELYHTTASEEGDLLPVDVKKRLFRRLSLDALKK